MSLVGHNPSAPHPNAHTAAPTHVVLAHGGGGQLTDELLNHHILPKLGNELLDELLDATALPALGHDRPALTIDAYVVQPWRFPGGDIGRLAVCGTVNDLAVTGATPLGLALSAIVAEGFALADLDAVMASVGRAAAEAGVRVVTGDTKVVHAGSADGIYLTTAGIGRAPASRKLRPANARPGDLLLINGPIGEHGLAVMLAREMPGIGSAVASDVAPLNALIADLLDAAGDGVVFMRDATRSGLAGVGSDLARASGLGVSLDEQAIPVRPAVAHAAEMLGLDVLEVANEGRVVVVVRPGAADVALAAMKRSDLGTGACVIGEVRDGPAGVCELRTHLGGRRVVAKPYGEHLPRIC